jgi:hypothetical protein
VDEKQRKESASEATPATLCQSGKILPFIGHRKVCPLENPCESSMKKSIGKPCEGKLHARFDEGGADSSEMKLSCEVIIIKVLSGPTLRVQP